MGKILLQNRPAQKIIRVVCRLLLSGFREVKRTLFNIQISG